MKCSGIYKIQSISHPERCYIGSAVNLRRRWNNHLSELRLNKHHSKKLQNHYNKYGESDLIFIIIEPCFPKFLTIREQFYIDDLNPYFNINPIARSSQGVKRSEEFKQKLRIVNTGRKDSEERRRKVSESHKGIKLKPLSKEHKLKLSLAHKGKNREPFPEDHKQKMRESHTGKRHSDETKKKIGKLGIGRTPWNKGLECLESCKRKISQSNIGKRRTEEQKKKLSNSRKNWKFTEEAKMHMRKPKPVGFGEKIKNSWVKRKLKKSA
jgi:group I intron endonuclease